MLTNLIKVIIEVNVEYKEKTATLTRESFHRELKEQEREREKKNHTNGVRVANLHIHRNSSVGTPMLELEYL